MFENWKFIYCYDPHKIPLVRLRRVLHQYFASVFCWYFGHIAFHIFLLCSVCISTKSVLRKSKALKCHCSRRRDFIFTFITFELYTRKSKWIPFLESTDNFLSFVTLWDYHPTKFEKMYKDRFFKPNKINSLKFQ